MWLLTHTQFSGAAAWGGHGNTGLGQPLPPWVFCHCSLRFSQTLAGKGRLGVGMWQGAGDQEQGVWEDLQGSRLDCELLQGKMVMWPQCLAQSRCSIDIHQLSRHLSAPYRAQLGFLFRLDAWSPTSRVLWVSRLLSLPETPVDFLRVTAPTHIGHMVTICKQVHSSIHSSLTRSTVRGTVPARS